MRIAVIGPYSVDAGRIGGGPEAVVVQLVDALRRRGDAEVHVVAFDYSRQLAEDTMEQLDGVTLHRLRLRRLPRWTTVRVNARALARRLREIAPDIAHAHSSGTYADGALASGIPTVITVHGVIQQEAQVFRQFGIPWREDLAWRYEAWYERRNLRLARDLIAISPYVTDFYRGLTAARMHLVENPVADSYFHLADAVEPGTVLCAARIIRRKNIMALLQAFARVHQDLPTARLRLAGETASEPGYADQCRQFVSQQGLEEAVEFLGWLDEAALQVEYSRCAALALVSWQETAPVVIEQAMAAGKPVVASDVGGVRYLVADEVTGFLVKPDDIAGQAAALQSVLADETMAQAMGAAARLQAQARFHPDHLAAQTMSVYQSAIANQRTQ